MGELIGSSESKTAGSPPSSGTQAVPIRGIWAGWYGVVIFVIVLLGKLLDDLFYGESLLVLTFLAILPLALTLTYIIDQVKRGKNRIKIVVESILMMALLFMVAAILVPNFFRARAAGELSPCKSNLKNIGTALEMYSTDNYGRYPVRLEMVTPNYIRVIPTCPYARKQSYVYVRRENPDVYTIYCSGRHHGKVIDAENYPQYDSIQGLMEP
jgi:hypothetical protein